MGRPYPEVTVAVLPSSLKRVLSYTLGYSPHSPVSVYGTDTLTLALEVFLVSSYPCLTWPKPHLQSTKQTGDPDLPRSSVLANNAHTIDAYRARTASLHRKIKVVLEY